MRQEIDYRREPLEYVRDTRTGVVSIELRGATDRAAVVVIGR